MDGMRVRPAGWPAGARKLCIPLHNDLLRKFFDVGRGQPRLCERTTRGEPWLREASAERSWSIFPGHRSFYSSRKKGEGALMARIPSVADTDGTDLALPLEVARRSGSICVGEAGAVIPSHISR